MLMFLIDSGSSSNIIDKSTLKVIQKRIQILSYKSQRNICQTPLSVIGDFDIALASSTRLQLQQ